VSGGIACSCTETAKPVAERQWGVLDYKCNHSKFNGGHYTPSDYSAVTCKACGAVWRTKAAYVDQLPFADVMAFAIGKAVK
jgi:hypothetical protein